MAFTTPSSVPDEGTYKGVYYTWADADGGAQNLKSAGGWRTLSAVDFNNMVSGGTVPAGSKFTELFIKVESGSNIYFTFGAPPSNDAGEGDAAFVDEFYQKTMKIRRYEAYQFEVAGLDVTRINIHSIGTSQVRILATFE